MESTALLTGQKNVELTILRGVRHAVLRLLWHQRSAEFGMPGLSAYGASKAAVALLTKAWAAEYGPKGVRVNAVSPGPTRTEGTAAMGDALQQLAAQAPAGRPAAGHWARATPEKRKTRREGRVDR